MNIADILDKAADLIEPEGKWRQGGYGDEHSFCMGGACNLAAGRSVYDCYMPTAVFLAKFLGLPTGPWNDAPERTQADVVAKLREAAALAREQSK